MDILKRIIELRDERNWTNYKLAKMANIPQSTLTNLIKHNNLPTVTTLISMCDAFGITLLQFFTDKDNSFLTPEQENLIAKWSILTDSQRGVIIKVIDEFLRNRE